MPQIIVDSVALRRFASVLEQEVKTLHEHQRSIEASRRDLALVWRDARYTNFEQTYLPTIQVLQRFEKSAEQYAAYLRKKADRVDRYLGRR
jgi:uncharacterized protein YukE